MPTDSEVLSERAESAFALINETLGQHQRQLSRLGQRASPPRLGHEVHDPQLALSQATIARVATIMESFCVDRLTSMAEGAIRPDEDPVRRALFDDAIKSATGSWSSIRGAYRDWYGVRPDWKQLEAIQEVRNAIAHGLGVLTHRQVSSRDATMARLQRLGLQVDSDNRLIIATGDVLKIAQVCKSVIDVVDERTR